VVNSEELTGTTEYLTLHTRCSRQRCRYNRVRIYTYTHTHTHTHTHSILFDIADLLMRTVREFSFLVTQGSVIWKVT